MSETGNPPATETLPDAAPEIAAGSARPEGTPVDPVSAGEAPAAEPAAEVAAEPAAAAATETPAESAGEGVAATAGEAAPAGERKPGKGRGKGKGAGKRPAHRRSTRSEEFVAPTPEELEGIPSEGVRLAVREGLPVAGKVIGWNQGGFHVAVDGITGFCPRSSMEIGPPREPAQYLDQILHFRVLRVEEKGHRLILSRAAALREERRHQAEEMRKSLEVGAELEGRVVALTDFGAFVDLGGIEGLLHVSELRHGRVGKPADVLTVGQTVKVKVIKLGSGGERVSLSIKALEPDPWAVAAEKWTSGQPFSGKVLRKTDFGWFVELAEGVEGLLHPSQLLPGMGEDDAKLAPGATIEGWVRELDTVRHRVSLSLRETPAGNPWEGVEARYAEGAVVTGTVEKIQPFGVFVTLEPGLTGLLPGSETGLPRGASLGKAYPVGKQIQVQVSQVEPRRKRISLTLEGKTLEGSRADYQAYLKKTRSSTSMGALAAALSRLKDSSR